MTEVLEERGYAVTPSVVRRALGRFDVRVEMGPEFRAYTIAEAESLLEGGRIESMPAWGRVLRRDLFDQAVRA